MTVVLVHGVPETPAVWERLRRELGRLDVVAVQLPGFGSARPDGFRSTKEEYVDFLVGELERVADEPVDIVGHDWGGGFVVRLVSTRPDLVRSWVTDAAGLGSEKFAWHDFAKLWQTPGEGEQFFEQQLGMPVPERASGLEMFGVPHDDAVTMAGWIDPTMADSILALYRSAVDVGKEWFPAFHDIPAPGLVLLPSEDPFLSEEHAREGAGRAGANTAPLPGLGHWWMLQDPKAGARALGDFWAGVDSRA
jgi:pimeloyl-ACP methyl ester carboxylesterase